MTFLPEFVKMRLWSVADIVLRVPPVFAMDAILNYKYGEVDISTFTGNETIINTVFRGGGGDDSADLPINLRDFGFFGFSVLSFVTSCLIFLLPRYQLAKLYVWLMSVAIVTLAYFTDISLMKQQLTQTDLASLTITFFHHLTLQIILANAFQATYFGLHDSFSNYVHVLAFVGPPFFSLFPLTEASVLYISIGCTVVLAGSILIGVLWNLYGLINFAIDSAQRCRIFARHYGLHTLLENEWARLHIPKVLRVFWLTQLAHHLIYLAADSNRLVWKPGSNWLAFDNVDFSAFQSLTDLFKELLVQGSNTIIAVMGLTSVVASTAHYAGVGIQQFLATEDLEERSIGTVSAILFFILALQTGLTGLEPDKRWIRLYRNFCLLFTAVMHFVHNMVSPLLMTLSASRNRQFGRHARALLVCFFLLTFPIWFLVYLWRQHTITTWLLAVSAFSTEVIIKVFISLLIYMLFMFDAYCDSFWENLDDYIYYIKATGNTIEFIFGIFLFFNGSWILLFESGGTIRALMMCVHAYFNIWTQARHGWDVFMKRRTAVYKIDSLPKATPEQLRKFDDVCAICYQELKTARITFCNHFFHGVCLRKWLYIQDKCPLCHEILYKQDSATVPPPPGAGGRARRAGPMVVEAVPEAQGEEEEEEGDHLHQD